MIMNPGFSTEIEAAIALRRIIDRLEAYVSPTRARRLDVGVALLRAALDEIEDSVPYLESADREFAATD